MDNYQDILTNFQIKELATNAGEFNYDLRHLLAMQACRSWMGVPWYFADGGGCRHYDWESDSTHNIIKWNPVTIIPATGADPYNPDLDTWEFMDKVEEWIERKYNANKDVEVVTWKADYNLIMHNMTKIEHPIFSGRGVYPDTNNQCIHLDCGHLSMNPVIREKRKGVTRWCRIKREYHYAADGETFAELRGRLGL